MYISQTHTHTHIRTHAGVEQGEGEYSDRPSDLDNCVETGGEPGKPPHGPKDCRERCVCIYIQILCCECIVCVCRSEYMYILEVYIERSRRSEC